MSPPPSPSSIHTPLLSLILLLFSLPLLTLATPTPAAKHHPTANLTLTFGPYRTVACEQSFGPGPQQPVPLFNLTEHTCLTTPYAFGSFFVNAFVNGSQGVVGEGVGMGVACNLTIFKEAGCKGGGKEEGKEVKELQLGFPHCEIPGFTGESVRVRCAR